MMRALWSSASGMIAQQKNIDVISNNISNVNTAGFKRSRADFQDMIYQTIRPAGAINLSGAQIPTGIEIGHGARLVATPRMFSEGSLQETGNDLDLAIAGDGFFQVKMPDDTIAYTRAGNFSLDKDGRIVTADGLPLVEPEIIIPPGAEHIYVTDDGDVQVTIPGQTEGQSVGQIEIVRFMNPAGLHSLGHSLFVQTEASGAPNPGKPGENGLGTIERQTLEMSNVQIVDEMVGLIVAQRAYEVNSKAIQTADEMLGIANGLRR